MKKLLLILATAMFALAACEKAPGTENKPLGEFKKDNGAAGK